MQNGTITDEQKDKIQEAFANAVKFKEAREAYNVSSSFADSVGSLADSGVLTDDQAQSVNQALYNAFGQNSRFMFEL